MPRHARVNAPGVVYHVMTRGIEKRDIFLGDVDREDFLERLEKTLPAHGCRCLAWALMPNHVHLLLQAGEEGTSEFMRSLLTGYAVSFNLRHDRVGHLFANRYKSIVCVQERYIMALIRYINLNPLRGGIVRGLGELRSYPWCSHGALCGRRDSGFLDARGILSHFDEDLPAAMAKYERFICDGVGKPCPEPAPMTPEAAERRVGAQNATKVRDVRAAAQPMSCEDLLKICAAHAGVSPEAISGERGRHAVSKGKALAVFLGVTLLGMRKSQMAGITRMSRAAATGAFRKGLALAENSGLLEKLKS